MGRISQCILELMQEKQQKKIDLLREDFDGLECVGIDELKVSRFKIEVLELC